MGKISKYYKTYLPNDLRRLSQLNERIGKASKDKKQVNSLVKTINFISSSWAKTQKSFFK